MFLSSSASALRLSVPPRLSTSSSPCAASSSNSWNLQVRACPATMTRRLNGARRRSGSRWALPLLAARDSSGRLKPCAALLPREGFGFSAGDDGRGVPWGEAPRPSSLTETQSEARSHLVASRPRRETLFRRIANCALAGLGACALMVTTADATGLVDSAKTKPRTSAQKPSKPGPSGATRQDDRHSGQRRTRRTSKTGGAEAPAGAPDGGGPAARGVAEFADTDQNLSATSAAERTPCVAATESSKVPVWRYGACSPRCSC